MSETLDRFLPPSKVKPNQRSEIFVEERGANPKCRKILKITDVKYTLRIKGKKEPYCQNCAKKILRPQENREENV